VERRRSSYSPLLFSPAIINHRFDGHCSRVAKSSHSFRAFR
jgi:hypothetical protein